jgi:RHS repeat-associated protein
VFVHTDALGSITAATNSAGAVVSRVSYTPFGEVASVEGSAPVVAFTGQIFDAETGLYYVRARYYDPASGRFTQPDPAGWVPGANHESTYLYGAGSPLTNVDPTGLRIERADRQAAAAEAARVRNDPLGAFTNWIAQPHNALDVLGMVPIVGEAFDLANAALYLAEGNWSMAALSAIAIVPLAGDALAKGTKYGDEALAATGLVARNADNGPKAIDAVTHQIDDLTSPLKQGDTLGNGIEATNPGRLLYRADTRGPSDIFISGFEPKGNNLDLWQHVTQNPPDSGFVSTSKTLEGASELETGDPAYVYRLEADGVDVNATFGDESPFPWEHEVAVPRVIPSCNIVGCTSPAVSGFRTPTTQVRMDDDESREHPSSPRQRGPGGNIEIRGWRHL